MKQGNSKDKKYCTKEFSYPIKAFTAYFYMIEENTSLFYPTTRIYTSISEIASEAKFIEEMLPPEQNMILSDSAVVVPLNLERLYPMKESFWQKPSIHYDHNHRLKLFMKAMDNLSFYKLVVTPIKSQNKTVFIGAVPIFSHATDKIIETFMMYSDFPVDETSKYAAIYEFGKPISYNIRTGETKELVKEKRKSGAN
jgi:hypothetical protein